MTTRGQINSNFYQTVNVDADGNPISIKSTLIPVAGSNSQIQFNNNSSFGASANLTFDTSTNTLSATHFSGNGSGITNISATNIVGNVANANHATSANTANTANTVTTAAQPNITSVGTLSSLHSTGNITAPFFIGNVVGNISGNLVVPGANTSVLYNQEGSAGASDAFQFDYDANVLTVIGDVVATNFSGTGAGLNNLNGANISEVANATFATDAGVAYSVDGANVSGEVTSANYASYAGNVTVADQPNITSVGTLTSLAVSSANITLGADTNQTADGTATYVSGGEDDGGGYALPMIVTDIVGNITIGSVLSGDGWTSGQVITMINDYTEPGTTYLYVSAPYDSTPSGTITFTGTKGTQRIELGVSAGQYNQQANSTAIGAYAGQIGQSFDSTAIGAHAGSNNQSDNSIAIGTYSGANLQGGSSIAIGTQAGQELQGGVSIAIGTEAGQTTQQGYGAAIGYRAGNDNQGLGGTAIGAQAGLTNQGGNAIAIGWAAGANTQGTGAVAVGRRAGRLNQGDNSIAIGLYAGYTNQATNSIILNATGAQLNQTTANTFTVKPVRNANTANVMFYDSSSGEITYDVLNVSDVNHANIADVANSVAGGNVSGEVTSANYASYAGNVTIASQGNITSVGNLTTLTVNDGNVRHPTIQVTPSGNIVGLASGNLAMITINDYGSQGSNAQTENITFIKSRGNSAVPTAAANSDTMLRLVAHVYNGNTYPRAATIAVTAPFAANANFQYSNVAWTPGSVSVVLGHPMGNAQSTTASAYTQYIFSPYGTVTIQPPNNNGGLSGATNPGFNIISCGAQADGSGAGATNSFSRNRGTILSPTAVQNGDYIGQLWFTPYNGSGYYQGAASITAVVNTDSGSIVPGGRVPTDIIISTSSNTSGFISTFDGAGNLTIPGVYNGDGGGLSNIAAANISGLGNIATINLDGDASNVLKGDGTWGVGGGGAAGYDNQVQFNNGGALAGAANLYYSPTTDQLMLNGGVAGGFSVTLVGGEPGDFVLPQCTFNRYSNTHDVATYSIYRAEGTETAPLPVATGDTIFSQYTSVYSGVGYELQYAGSFRQYVKTNDGAGNVTISTTYDTSSCPGSDFTIDYSDINLNGNVTANNVSVNSGGFIKYAAFASTDLTAITGSIGQMASVSDNGGKLAYWDTINSRWSYVFDNSAV
jgi:hypothetical protein